MIQNRTSLIVISTVIVCLTVWVYLNVKTFDFVYYDDDIYVTDNGEVLQGVTWEGLITTFKKTYGCNWQPLTIISHMLDVHLWGKNPGMHHVMSLIIHIANSLLLFLLLCYLTQLPGRSFLVAVVFAIHPMHVESVAWISERKDVLSCLFFLLTVGAYVKYVAKHQFGFYLFSLLCFILGLMAKSMLVTLPFVLMLLDVWPLNRIVMRKQECSVHDLFNKNVINIWIIEKAPFLAVSLVFCVITVWAQGKAIGTLETFPLMTRLSNACVSYLFYIIKFFVPINMAVFYPYPETIPIARSLFSLGILLCVTCVVLARMRTAPYLFTGWFFFLGTLVPVIGIVQVGLQSMADRYTYLPYIGICIMVVWGVADLVKRFHISRNIVTAVACGCVLLLSFLARQQVAHWKNSVTLAEHANRITKENFIANAILGDYYRKHDMLEKALAFLEKSIMINPGFINAHLHYGEILVDMGEPEKAVEHYQSLLEVDPDLSRILSAMGFAKAKAGYPDQAIAYFEKDLKLNTEPAFVHGRWGFVLFDMGMPAEAIPHFETVLKDEPNNEKILFNLGASYVLAGQPDRAIEAYQKALDIEPNMAKNHFNLANIFKRKNMVKEAEFHYRKALETDQDYVGASYNLAVMFLEQKRFDEAISEFHRTLRLNPSHVGALNNLGLAYERKGRFDQAVACYIRLLKEQPDNLDTLNNYGNALLQMGKIDEAINQYKMVLRLNPDHANAKANLSMVYSVLEARRVNEQAGKQK